MTDHVTVFEAALRGEPCHVAGLSAKRRPLPVQTWQRVADEADAALVELCVGTTIDIGCGPGRMAQALAARGSSVLGIDISSEAVAQTRARGSSALVRDVFAPLPGEGRWDTALLADGNVGIGGNPVVLMRRVGALLRPGGRAVVEVSRPGVGVRTVSLALVSASARSRPFPWSLVGVDAVGALAAAADLTVERIAERDGRWIAVFERRRR